MPVSQQKWTPRYFTVLTHGIWLLFNIIWQQGFWPPKVITWLLRGLNFISHFVPYTLQILTSCCRPWQEPESNTMSSAYRTQPINRKPICTPWPDSGLDGGLWLADFSLTCARKMVGRWPLSGYTFRSGSAKYANSAFHTSVIGKWVVIHVFIWNTGVETINRLGLSMGVWLQVKVHKHGLGCSLGWMPTLLRHMWLAALYKCWTFFVLLFMPLTFYCGCEMFIIMGL